MENFISRKMRFVFIALGGILFLVSVLFNGYIFFQSFIEKMRVESINIAIERMAEVAQRDGKITFSGIDAKTQKPTSLTLIIPPVQTK